MTNCAFDCGNKCKALEEKQCKGCTFYKTTEELEKGRQKAEKRIRSLSTIIQTHVRRKYYTRTNPLK